jgi:glycosyltransferase involved in cell wall biosynthesis
MHEKKFSVIIPIYNEIDWVVDFLSSVYNQTRKPDEIIVVDWKSRDGTLDILKKEEEDGKIKLFSFKSNIAEARNFAIKHCKNEIILCTDAWCQIDRHRCENIMKVYETTNEKVVWWKSELISENKFQSKAKHRLVATDINNIFVSSRNISFYKEVWEISWWYPEYLTKRGEDTYFNLKIKRAWYKIYYCPSAIVKRHMWKHFKDIYKMYRNYTQWDAEVYVIHWDIQSDSIKKSIIFSVFWLILLLIIIFGWYIWTIIAILTILGLWIYKRSPWWYIFDLRFTICKLTGMTVWFWKWIFAWIWIRIRISE